MKLYCFFNQFNQKLYNYSKQLLDLTAVIGCLVSIWVFGNTDYFGSPSLLTPRRVTAIEHSNSTLQVLSEPLTHRNQLNNHQGFEYGFELLQRATQTLSSQILSLCLLVYLSYLILFCFLKCVKKYTSFKPSLILLQRLKKKGVGELARFEDLVCKNDVVYQSTLASVMKGREVGGPRVCEINERRLGKLNAALRQSGGGGEVKEPGDAVEVDSAKRAQKFITLSSYDYRVSQKLKKMKIEDFAIFDEFLLIF